MNVVNGRFQGKPIKQAQARNKSLESNLISSGMKKALQKSSYVFQLNLVLIHKEFEENFRDISCRGLIYLFVGENRASIGVQRKTSCSTLIKAHFRLTKLEIVNYLKEGLCNTQKKPPKIEEHIYATSNHKIIFYILKQGFSIENLGF